MRPLPTVRDCPTKPELLEHIREVHEGISAFVREIPPELLNGSAYPEGWTAARNVRHVAKTTRLVASWVGAPSWLMRLWGRPSKPNARASDLEPTNRPHMTDYGHYDRARAATPAELEKLIVLLDSARDRLCRAVEKKSEEELDALPAFFGGTNVRLFVLFALKHMVHHVGVARSRLEASTT